MASDQFRPLLPTSTVALLCLPSLVLRSGRLVLRFLSFRFGTAASFLGPAASYLGPRAFSVHILVREGVPDTLGPNLFRVQQLVRTTRISLPCSGGYTEGSDFPKNEILFPARLAVFLRPLIRSMLSRPLQGMVRTCPDRLPGFKTLVICYASFIFVRPPRLVGFGAARF